MFAQRRMLKNIKLAAIIGLFLLPAVQAGAGETPAFKDNKEKVSYGIGVGVARDFKNQGIELDMDSFLKGLKDGISGSKLLMTESDLQSTMSAYVRELKTKRAEALKKEAEDNKKAGEEFFAANAKKEGVKVLSSGVEYKVVDAGKGKMPSEADTVKINYRGIHLDGTEFDSSYPTGHPAVFKIAGLIPGLKEALKLMPVGSKWVVFVPSSLAYGERGAGRLIGPNQGLIFEVELVSIENNTDNKEPATEPASQASAGTGGVAEKAAATSSAESAK